MVVGMIILHHFQHFVRNLLGGIFLFPAVLHIHMEVIVDIQIIIILRRELHPFGDILLHLGIRPWLSALGFLDILRCADVCLIGHLRFLRRDGDCF